MVSARSVGSVLVLLVLAVLVSACNGRPVTELSGTTWGTTYSIKYVGDVPSEQVHTKVRDALESWDALFSTWREDSEISRFNAHRSIELFRVSSEFRTVVSMALELADKTGGAFDPTVGPLLRTYGFGAGAEERSALPTDAEIRAAMQRVGYEKLELLAGRGLKKNIQDLELDLNAIAKGSGVDRIVSLLESELKLTSFMVEIGGEVRCKGKKPDGKPWTIGVEGPDSDRSDTVTIIESVPLRDEAMATSGSYRQFREYGERRVHHILDPRTGRNAESNVVSVSVVASSCELADGLATAMMVVGPDGCEEIVSRYPGTGIRVLFLLRGEGGKIERKGFGWK